MKRTINIKIKLTSLLLFLLTIIGIQKNSLSQPSFIENKGQFQKNVFFKLKHNSGNIYFEKSRITYQLFQKDKLYKLKHQQTKDSNIKGHVYSASFVGANLNPKINGNKKKETYHNYFLGNDSLKWAKNVSIFNSIKYEELYEGIDLMYYEKNGHLKYDFIVDPNNDPQQILIKYEGVEKIYLKSGHLVITTSIGDVIEQAPMAFQIIDNKEIQIKCKYVLKSNNISFLFPEGYNKNHELIIDPVLIFSTYSGSTADNWGQTATYDNSGNLYAGSIAFSLGYPTTTGSFQSSFAGGDTDICISKFNADGTNLIYSTYLGGNNNENPHSLVVNDDDELYMLGSTGSSNFPTTTGAYDESFNGGNSWSFGASISYNNGIDIIVVKFSSDGNNLAGSTFVGGSGNDGINESGSGTYNNSGLCNFYSDEYRGEIILDDQSNCYIASTTKSTDFPMVEASQLNIGGLQDAVAFSLNEDLTNLRWSTYYGGSQNDASYSIQLNDENQIFITGGTMSNDLFTTSNTIHPGYNGGVDGFIIKFDQSYNASAATYIGNSGYNQSYFLQVDIEGNIFIFGLTQSQLPISPSGVYNSTGSHFIQKITPELDSLMISSSFGTGSVTKTITPSAFLVSDCGLIYVCGWGGLSGVGSTANLPITTDAFQSTTDGSDFYLGVFEQDMQSLLYGTYFGGNQSDEHVDGGTSRFDKNGKVYQAVCAGCPSNDDFPTTPGVVSNTNGSSSNCNLGVFKFAFETVTTAISVPNFFACLPNTYDFNSQSQGGNLYYWDFGDGTTSNLMNPSHIYSDTGTFDVSLVVSDSISCVTSDTSFIQINIYAVNNAQIIGDNIICGNGFSELTAYGGNEYTWIPSSGLSNNNSNQVIANPDITTNYMVIATDSCGIDTAFFNLQVFDDEYSLSGDTTICLGDSISILASGGVNYNWTGSNIISSSSSSPIVFPVQNTYYNVAITSPNGCVFMDSINIEIDSTLPFIILDDTLKICSGDSAFMNPSNISNAIWSPFINLSNNLSTSTWTNTTEDMTYYINSTNSCGIAYDSIVIIVFGHSGAAYGDTSICQGDSAFIYVEDGNLYSWYPIENINYPDSCCTYVNPFESTVYNVIVENVFGCKDTFDTEIIVIENPLVDAGEDQWINFGQQAILNGTVSSNLFYWESNEWLSCYDCLTPQINPNENTTYILNTIDTNGCKNIDSVEIYIKGNLYVPNTFTPNSDGANDLFEIKGELIETYEIWIFNRWGELVFNSTDISESWNGMFKNTPAELGGYVWEIEFSDFSPEIRKIKGHLNLLR